MLEQAATDAADQRLPQGRAVIGSCHDHIDRKIDRTRQQNVMDAAVSADGFINDGDDIVPCQVPTHVLHRNTL
jgi:hypothetical protein